MTTPHPSDPGPTGSALPAVLCIEPWPDPLIDRLGHDPRSAYVETFWLGILGPTATWLIRLLCAELEAAPADGATLDLAATARRIGVGHKGGQSAPVRRSLVRLAQFGLVQPQGTTLRVRRHLPTLTLGQLKRLPDHLRTTHEQWPVPEPARAG